MKSFRSSSSAQFIIATIVAGLVVGTLEQARGSISYSSLGSLYSENFNSLPTDPTSNAALQPTPYANGWQDDTTTVAATRISIPGWYLWHPLAPTGSEIGANGHQRFREGAGQNTGSFWGFGSTAADADKALGSIGSTTTANNGDSLYIALRLVNDTGIPLDSITLTYDGEEWRDGQATFGETLLFGYSLTASLGDWNTTATFNGVSALDFTSPVFSGTGTSGTAVDGNSAGLTAGITATISGIYWAPGAELWLRWADPQLASNADDGLAIDNVRFSAIPEPSTFVLLGLGVVGLVAIRRR